MQSESPFFYKLDTNYSATTAEIPAIQTWILNQQAIVNSLDDELAELDLRRKELEERKRAPNESIKKHRSLMSCARRIPADILSTIFSDLLLLEGPDVSPYPAVTASHVCRLWRDVALGTPLLWTNLIINLPSYPYPFSEDAQAHIPVKSLSEEERGMHDVRLLQYRRQISNMCDRLVAFGTRSAQCPLLFSLLAHDEHQGEGIRKAVELEDLGAYQDAVESIAQVAFRTHRRWETVRIHLKMNSYTPILLPLVDFAQLSRANTRTLDLDLEYIGEGDVYATWESLKEKVRTGQSPLTSITARMTYTDVCRIEARWGELTDLTLGLKDHVSHRHFQNVLEVLQRTSRLRQLSLEFPSPAVHINPRGPLPNVRLPYLECLTIRGTGPSSEFAAALELPTLTSLSLAHVTRSTANGGATVEWIRRYGPQLTHLSFGYAYFSEASLVWIFNNIPNIYSLEICCSKAEAEFVVDGRIRDKPLKVSPQVLKTLTPMVNESGTDVVGECLCPKLERLAWTFGEGHGRRIKESLLDLIASRRSVPRDGSGTITWLKEVDAVFVTGPMDFMFDELWSRGVDLRGVRLRALYEDERSRPPIQSIPVPGIGGSVFFRGVVDL